MITSGKLGLLIFCLNSLSDKGEKLELSEIGKLLDGKVDILKWLNNKYGNKFDISLLEPNDFNQIHNFFYSTINALEASDYRVSNNGINLLIAYLLEGMININSDPNFFEQYNS